MQNQLSKEEQKIVNRWLRTDTGTKLLAGIKDFEQGFLNSAMLGVTRQLGNDYIAQRVAAAEAVAQIFEWLKPPENETDGEEQ